MSQIITAEEAIKEKYQNGLFFDCDGQSWFLATDKEYEEKQNRGLFNREAVFEVVNQDIEMPEKRRHRQNDEARS